MSESATLTLTLEAIQYALSAHLTARHATSLQVDAGCAECLALLRAVQAAAGGTACSHRGTAPSSSTPEVRP